MATATDAARVIQKIGAHQASSIARSPTGIEPGYDPSTGITWTEDGRARYRSGGGVGMYASTSTGQSIADDTETNVNLDIDPADVPGVYDTSSFWDSGNPDELTFPRDGMYHADYLVQWEGSATGDRGAWLQFDYAEPDGGGSLQVAHQMEPAAADVDGHRQSGATLCNAQAGDTLILKVYQSSGGSLDVNHAEVKIHYIGPRIAAPSGA